MRLVKIKAWVLACLIVGLAFGGSTIFAAGVIQSEESCRVRIEDKGEAAKCVACIKSGGRYRTQDGKQGVCFRVLKPEKRKKKSEGPARRP